jgi:uncharacterized membrane protein YagU involved in acid resistance
MQHPRLRLPEPATRYGDAADEGGAPMVRRLVVSFVLAVILIVLQLLLGHVTIGTALLTGLIAFVIAFFVLLISDRYFTRSGRP